MIHRFRESRNLPFLSLTLSAALAFGAACAPADSGGGTDGEEAVAVPTRDETPVIAREVLFGNLDDVMNIWVAPASDPKAAEPVTNDTGRGIAGYGFAYDGQHLIYIQDEAGDENWRVYSVDLGTKETTDLTPLAGVQARIMGFSPTIPDEILVGLNDRDPRLHDIYRVSLATGERTLVLQNDGFERFVTDREYNVRAAGRFVEGGDFELLKPSADGTWEPFLDWGLEDSESTFALGFDDTGATLYMQDSRGRNTAALTAVSASTGARKVMAEDPMADLSGTEIHPLSGLPQAAEFTHGRSEWQVLDESIAGDFEYLGAVADGEMGIGSRTLDDTRWIVTYLMDDGPVRYYLYDREAQQATLLFTSHPELEALPLSKMHFGMIESRDGLELVSYLTLPPWADADGDARPDDGPIPMVLSVHGGPWARDSWGLDPWHQWLANRGYAVLSVNFRGSTGFGKEYVNASTGEWAGKMHDDLIDGVNWAVEQGITEPDKVAIMGGSYGGFATLVGMTFTPEAFACGVDLVGPSNIVTLFESFPAYWGPRIERWVARVGGDHRTEEGREYLMSRSPISRADQIVRPLLIAQGSNDPRVNQAESDQIVAEMQSNQIPVTYLVYPDEGHGFRRPPNNMSFHAVAEAFLNECLGGGRVEPIGDDFAGSTITVPVGAEHVPGLEEALAGMGEGS
jgi:dipeptidyl aminopeptidase/acylaminoacyl peptidase